VTSGSDQTFTITPDSGYEIATLTIDGATTTPTSTFTFVNVTTDHSIEVTFSEVVVPVVTHTIVATSSANGLISPVGSTTVTSGSDQTFTITPDSGYEIATLTIDGATTTPTSTFTFVNVTTDHSIEVTFSEVVVPVVTHTIVATSSANGLISPVGSTTVTSGSDQTFTITPDSGYEIATLTIDGATTTPTSTFTFVNVTTDHSIEVTFSEVVVPVVTHTIVATSSANGLISPVGSTTVTSGSDQTFTITPDSGYEIATLTIDGATTTPTSTFTFVNVTTDHSIEVTFSEVVVPVVTHTIVATSSANGLISPVGSTTVTSGSDQTFTITPDSGYEIATLTIDGATTTPTSTFTFVNVTTDHSIEVTFIEKHTITLTVIDGVGSVTFVDSPTLLDGSTAILSITPGFAYTLGTLLVDGVTTTPTTTYTFADLQADHSVAAIFVSLPMYVISSSTGGNGHIVSSESPVVLKGGSHTVHIVPDTGYALSTVTIDSVPVVATTTYTFANVTQDHSIFATFIKTHTIQGSSGSNGSVNLIGTTTTNAGTNQIVTITPDSGFGIKTLLVDGVTTTPTTTLVFNGIASDHVFDVTFAPLYDVVATLQGTGLITDISTTTVVEGNDQTIVVPNVPGYVIGLLVVDGVAASTTTEVIFTNVTTPHTVEVTYLELYEVVVYELQSGILSTYSYEDIVEGEDFTVTITPNPGFVVGTVYVDGATTTATSTYTVSGISSDHVVEIEFLELHSIQTLVGSNGTVTPSGVVLVPHGSSHSLTITPDSGYIVGSLIVDSVNIATSTTHTFANVTGDHTMSVSFLPVHTITLSSGPNGNINATGTLVVGEGTSHTFTITPDSGFGIATLTVDGVGVTPTTTVTIAGVVGDHTVDVTFARVYTISVIGGLNGTVTPSGTSTVIEGSDQGVTITPDFGYEISTLLIDGVTTTATSVVMFSNVTQNHAVEVTFAALPLYTIVAAAGEDGVISPVGSTTVPKGNNQTFTITPAYGYGVASLTIDGATTTPQTSYQFTNVQMDHTISVTFVQLPTHTILSSASENGTMSPVGTTTVIQGTNQTFFVTPGVGYKVGTTTIDAVVVANAPFHTFTNIQTDHTIEVTFIPLQTYTLTASVVGNGAITPQGNVSVFEGGSQTFTFTPGNGFRVGDVLINGSPVPVVGNSYSFTNVQGNQSIEVTFVPLPTHTITATALSNGSITPNGGVTVFEGYDQIFTITPSYGYQVDTLMVDGATTTATTTVTFSQVITDHTVHVTFVLLPSHTVTTNSGSNGNVTGSTTIPVGGNQVYTIVPDFGYTVGTLIVDGATTTPTTTVTFTGVNQDHTIEVIFVPLPTHTITATAGINGVITPNGSTTVFEGYNQVFTVTSNSGYEIATLTIDGATTTPTSTFTFVNVTTDHTIEVTFSAIVIPVVTHTILASAGSNGAISPVGSTTVTSGSDQTFTITSDSGYTVGTLTVDGVAVATSTAYTFTNVIAAHVIEVTFVALPAVIAPEENENSSSGSKTSTATKTRKKNVPKVGIPPLVSTPIIAPIIVRPSVTPVLPRPVGNFGFASTITENVIGTTTEQLATTTEATISTTFVPTASTTLGDAIDTESVYYPPAELPSESWWSRMWSGVGNFFGGIAQIFSRIF
jgi:hypothetical protein